VLSVLESTDWDVMEVTRLLEVSPSQVYALIRAFGLKKK
jgi:hypothetical protein